MSVPGAWGTAGDIFIKDMADATGLRVGGESRSYLQRINFVRCFLNTRDLQDNIYLNGSFRFLLSNVTFTLKYLLNFSNMGLLDFCLHNPDGSRQFSPFADFRSK